MIFLSNFSNTVFSHKFLWEIIKLEAKLVMNIKLYFHLSFRGSSLFWDKEKFYFFPKWKHPFNITGRNKRIAVTKGLCQSRAYTYASCAAGHLFYMHLNEKTLLALGWVKTDYNCMVLGARQNKSTLDNLRLDVKLRDWVCGLRGTIKAQCSQEIRLACSPKLYFQGILLRRRLLDIFSQLINLCMPQKYSFLTISQ